MLKNSPKLKSLISLSRYRNLLSNTRVSTFSPSCTITQIVRYSSHHRDTHDDVPFTDNDGLLFGWPRRKKGEKRRKESWERPYFYLYFIPFILWIALLPLKPSYEVNRWGVEEALRRRKKRAENQPFAEAPEEIQKQWQEFRRDTGGTPLDFANQLIKQWESEGLWTAEERASRAKKLLDYAKQF